MAGDEGRQLPPRGQGYPELADRARAAYLRELARENCRGGGTWRGGDAANLAIGQGGVLVTPLQLARAYAAIANGGTLHSPRVGLRVVRPDGTAVREITPPVAGRLPASAQTLRFMVSWLGVQTFMNVGMTLGLTPIVGVPLPFVSYGGSATVAGLVAVGLLQAVHRSKAVQA
ncbi:FtsW/RodA/SpoVE family cell cycle protein [Nonomuraea sp. NPDC049419]|uniref:FtsW/RodA/SpoVE family cell cycle protein n=1 Tax=Nonomuraea sp. NPDC049419 TaxID=3155772 RepID=UPI00343E4DBB